VAAAWRDVAGRGGAAKQWPASLRLLLPLAATLGNGGINTCWWR